MAEKFHRFCASREVRESIDGCTECFLLVYRACKKGEDSDGFINFTFLIWFFFNLYENLIYGFVSAPSFRRNFVTLFKLLRNAI